MNKEDSGGLGLCFTPSVIALKETRKQSSRMVPLWLTAREIGLRPPQHHCRGVRRPELRLTRAVVCLSTLAFHTRCLAEPAFLWDTLIKNNFSMNKAANARNFSQQRRD